MRYKTFRYRIFTAAALVKSIAFGAHLLFRVVGKTQPQGLQEAPPPLASARGEDLVARIESLETLAVVWHSEALEIKPEYAD